MGIHIKEKCFNYKDVMGILKKSYFNKKKLKISRNLYIKLINLPLLMNEGPKPVRDTVNIPALVI